MNWIASSKIHVEILTPGVAVFGDRAYKELIKIKSSHKCCALI